MKECEQCGNPVDSDLFICPFCAGHQLAVPSSSLLVRRLDVGHEDDTSVHEARLQIQQAVDSAVFRGEDVVVVIHGYGSSGAGGRIRSMVRSEASRMLASGMLSAWLPGEDCHSKSRKAFDVAKRFPRIGSMPEWNRENPGITFFILI